MEPLMAPWMANLLSKQAGVDGPLHDKSFEPPVCSAESVADVGDRTPETLGNLVIGKPAFIRNPQGHEKSLLFLLG